MRGGQGTAGARVLRFTNCRILRGGALLRCGRRRGADCEAGLGGRRTERAPDPPVRREDLWVRGGRVLDPEKLFFEERRVADELRDCGGCILAPGFIDVQINGAARPGGARGRSRVWCDPLPCGRRWFRRRFLSGCGRRGFRRGPGGPEDSGAWSHSLLPHLGHLASRGLSEGEAWPSRYLAAPGLAGLAPGPPGPPRPPPPSLSGAARVLTGLLRPTPSLACLPTFLSAAQGRELGALLL